MKGFTVVKPISKTLMHNKRHKLLNVFSQFEAIDNNNILIFRNSNNKFTDDKIFSETEEGVFVTDGIIYNRGSVINTDNNYSGCIEAEHSRIIRAIRGMFCGLIYRNRDDRLTVFTDQTSSHPLYYYIDSDVFIAGSNIKHISAVLRTLKKNVNPSVRGAYYMLTLGIMLGSETLIDSIKKLPPGHFINLSAGKLTLKQYHHFNNTNYTNDSRKTIIEQLDSRFKSALKDEYQKDIEYGYRHIATLSGGIDSRANVMIASELGYKDITAITTSYPGYPDHTISKYISSKKNYEYIFHPLQRGDFLKDIKSPVRYNDGLVYYPGSAHLLHLLSQIDFTDFGLLHTGMIGDGVLGSFIKNSEHTKPSISRLSWYYTPVIEKVKNDIEGVMSHYPNAEMYNLYEKCFNGVFNGFWTTSHFTEYSSPFIDRQFLEYALSIPPKMKNMTKIEIEWLASRHPEITGIPTERYRARPDSSNFRYQVMFFRMKWIMHRLLGKFMPLSMVPYDFWYSRNLSLRERFDHYFASNIHLLDFNWELKDDAARIYKEGSFLKKSQVITLLAAYNLYGLE